MKLITIKLSPHDATILASFHNEFRADIEGDETCLSLKIAMNNFLEQVCTNMPEDSFEEAIAEVRVNQLLGKAPEN